MKMDYTEKEYELLKGNMKQILDYVIPLKNRVREYIYIPFGDSTDHRSHEYSICLNPNRIYGMAGRCSLGIEDNDTSKDYHIFNDNYFGPDYMAKLCRDWKRVKSVIMENINREQETLNSITNFEL